MMKYFALAIVALSTYIYSILPSDHVNFRDLTNHSLVTIGEYCSGVIVDDQKDLIATAYHCADAKNGLPTENIMITQDYYDEDGYKYWTVRYYAKLVKRDEFNDAAVLQVTAGDIPTGDAIAISDEPTDIGDTVYSLGNPLMYPHYVTKGIIVHKYAPTEKYRGMIIFDAIIDHGSSGGAMVNENGELIGINDIIQYRAIDLGLGIPIPVSEQWSGAISVKHITKLLKEIEEYKL